MLLSIYYELSLFDAHTMILIVHSFMNVNKLCLNQTGGTFQVDGTQNVLL